MLAEAGAPELERHDVPSKLLQPLVPQYEEALAQLERAVKVRAHTEAARRHSTRAGGAWLRGCRRLRGSPFLSSHRKNEGRRLPRQELEGQMGPSELPVQQGVCPCWVSRRSGRILGTGCWTCEQTTGIPRVSRRGLPPPAHILRPGAWTRRPFVAAPGLPETVKGTQDRAPITCFSWKWGFSKLVGTTAELTDGVCPVWLGMGCSESSLWAGRWHCVGALPSLS